MAKFLTTNGISSALENIIIEANSKLTLVSPFLQLSKTLYERLVDTSTKNIELVIVYGKDELKSIERKSLENIPNLSLYFFKNLHAKCYFNETQMIITSMNMYEFSEKNNREMGVLVNRDVDKDLYSKAIEEAESIIRSSEEIRQSKTKIKSVITRSKKPNYTKGYCIRCARKIKYNPETPYCKNCFSTWAQFHNSDYEECVCHKCGNQESTSMNKPQCKNCWIESKNKVF